MIKNNYIDGHMYSDFRLRNFCCKTELNRWNVHSHFNFPGDEYMYLDCSLEVDMPVGTLTFVGFGMCSGLGGAIFKVYSTYRN